MERLTQEVALQGTAEAVQMRQRDRDQCRTSGAASGKGTGGGLCA